MKQLPRRKRKLSSKRFLMPKSRKLKMKNRLRLNMKEEFSSLELSMLHIIKSLNLHAPRG
jgi:hypothetical protein